jgi:5-methylcytosine-specific restriction endonuclease McrA
MKSKKKKRFFSSRQRVTLFLVAQGICRLCKEPLPAGWHADHLVAFSKGGLTETSNGQALCAKCNLRKSDK